jgi:hypothetical protein
MAEGHGPHRGRPCPALDLARMPALRRGAILTLAFTITLPLFAGVTYDQTVRRGSFDGALPLQSRVPSLDPPVFDIPVTMYAPPLESARPETFKIVLQGDRLVRIGKDDSLFLIYRRAPLRSCGPRDTCIASKPWTKLRSASRRCSAAGIPGRLPNIRPQFKKQAKQDRSKVKPPKNTA